MIFSDYQFPETHKFGTEIRKTLEKVIRDYFALYCWSNDIKPPIEGKPWEGLDEDHSSKFKKIIYQIVSEQPFTIPQTEPKWGRIVFHFRYSGSLKSDFTILKDSIIRLKELSSMDAKYANLRLLRKELQSSGKLVAVNEDDADEEGLQFTENFVLHGSPSELSVFIYGMSTSGPDYIDLGDWKFGNHQKVEKALEAGEEPDPSWFLSWLMNPNLAKYGAIPKVLDEDSTAV